MKKYLLLLTVSILLFSCSKDDTNDETPNDQTFLERVDGQGFAEPTDEYGWENYIFFSNSEYFLSNVERNIQTEEKYCFAFKEGVNYFDGENETWRIVTNTYNSLIVEIQWEGDDLGERVEFSLNSSGNLTWSEGGDSFTLTKTTENYLALCND